MRTRKAPQFSFSLEVYESIRESVGRRRPETGGMIAGNIRSGLVTHFHFDEAGACGSASYSPDTDTLNRILEQWNKEKVRLLGFVHSHPPGGPERPSGGDEIYARAILNANGELPALLVPIVQVGTVDASFRLRVYMAERSGKSVRITRVPLRIYELSAKAEERANYSVVGRTPIIEIGQAPQNITATTLATAKPCIPYDEF